MLQVPFAMRESYLLSGKSTKNYPCHKPRHEYSAPIYARHYPSKLLCLWSRAEKHDWDESCIKTDAEQSAAAYEKGHSPSCNCKHDGSNRSIPTPRTHLCQILALLTTTAASPMPS
jgi:hypothetical protein